MNASPDIDAGDALGKRPEMAWLPLHDLVVDDRYQREISSKRGRTIIARMVNRFAWRRFQPVVVALREDGKYAVLDGQHRAEAARQVEGVDEVPCYIVDAADLARQADSFASINRDRVSVNLYQMHHSLIVAGDEAALGIKAACDAAGIVIPRYPQPKGVIKPGVTLAVTTIRTQVRVHGHDAVVVGLKLIREAFGERGGEITAARIRAVVQILSGPELDPLDRDKLRAAVAACDEFKAAHTAGLEGTAVHVVLRRMILWAYGGEASTAPTPASETGEGRAVLDQLKREEVNEEFDFVMRRRCARCTATFETMRVAETECPACRPRTGGGA